MSSILERGRPMVKPIALILLNWNTKAHTKNCIDSLLKYANPALFDIIVADNGSTDGSLNYLKELFPQIIYIDNKENLGFAEGNNRAIDYAFQLKYEYSLLLNNDTIIESDIVEALYLFLQNNKDVAAVQPAIYYLHDKQKLWNGELKFNSFWGFTYSKKHLPKIPTIVEWITGCCFLIRNEVLKEVGKFNTNFFLYYEDVELSFRIRQKGFKLCLLPSEIIFHEAGVSGQMASNAEGTLNPIIHYYLNRNKIWFIRRYGNKLFLIFNYLNLFVYWLMLLTYFTIKGKLKKRANLFKAIKDGFFTPSQTIWSS